MRSCCMSKLWNMARIAWDSFWLLLGVSGGIHDGVATPPMQSSAHDNHMIHTRIGYIKLKLHVNSQTRYAINEAYPLRCISCQFRCYRNKSSVVVEMGNRLTTIDMGRKLGDCAHFRRELRAWGCAPFGGELGSHLTQCRLGRGLPPYQAASW